MNAKEIFEQLLEIRKNCKDVITYDELGDLLEKIAEDNGLEF